MTNSEQVLERLQQFFSAMNAWEAEAVIATSFPCDSPERSALVPKLREIQSKYCTPGAKGRGLSFSSHLTYSNVTLGKIEGLSDGKYIVRAIKTHGPGVEDDWEFLLVRKGENWLISKLVRISQQGKRSEEYL